MQRYHCTHPRHVRSIAFAPQVCCCECNTVFSNIEALKKSSAIAKATIAAEKAKEQSK